jgi:2-polyprenyl-3-methyl-5-hydroxy-6-metoxy-1,4-benzoquinol methylase
MIDRCFLETGRLPLSTLIQERERLENIAAHFSMKDGFNGYMNKYRVSKILELCSGESVLDLGSADVFMAEALSPFFKTIVSVDGSKELIERARARLRSGTNITLIHSLIEEFHTSERFDLVLLSFILEHVADPVQVAAKALTFVKPGGAMFVMVPNARSLHRRLGVALGLLSKNDDFSEEDIRQGHRRVYTEEQLCDELTQAGAIIEASGTFFIKPLSNPQMEQLGTKLADAFFEVSRDLPGLGSMIFVKCKSPEGCC